MTLGWTLLTWPLHTHIVCLPQHTLFDLSPGTTNTPVIITTQPRVVHLDKHFTFYAACQLSAVAQVVAILSLVHTSVVCMQY